MIRAEQQTYDSLLASPAVLALVGSAIYSDEVQEEIPVPYIVFNRSCTEPVTTIHDGTPLASKVTLSLNCWADERLLAEQIGDAVIAALGQIITLLDRFSPFDETTSLAGSVLTVEIWET